MATTFFDMVYPFGRPATPRQTHRSRAHAGWGWRGVIMAWAFPASIPEAELSLILAGGSRARLAQPDTRTHLGVPQYRFDEVTLATVNRLLRRYAVDQQVFHNIACNAGRTVMLNFIGDTGSLTGVQYFAIGTSTAAPLSTDTQLGTEVYRQAPTTYTLSGNNQVISTTFSTSQGNYAMTEAGLFGDGATGTANSGQLFAHAGYVYTKTSAIVLINQYTITLT